MPIYGINSNGEKKAIKINGIKGDKGPKGDKGEQGPQGIQGPTGPNVNFQRLEFLDLKPVDNKINISGYNNGIINLYINGVTRIPANKFTLSENKTEITISGFTFENNDYIDVEILNTVNENNGKNVQISVINGPTGPKGDKGDSGTDGLTTAVSVNGHIYEQVDGTITLPNYPQSAEGPSISVEDSLTSTSSANALSANQGKILKTLIDEGLDGHKFKFLTQAEYDALTDEEKNDSTIEYHITDADTSSFNLTMGTVNGLAAGEAPTATIVKGTGNEYTINLGIPKGDKGDAGAVGPKGADGLTTKISVNGETYEQVDGTITLPNYPQTAEGSSISVEDSLTSTSSTNALSANQGKVLKTLIDEGLDGHKFKFLTQAEYNALSEDQKSDATIEYHITDAEDTSDFNLTMGTVTGLNAGESPTATVVKGTGNEYTINLGIPKGDKGDKGEAGSGGTTHSNYIYAEDYGAVGDGSTDDTKAIQDAINAANSQNKTLKLMAKHYKIIPPLYLPSKINIEGANIIKNIWSPRDNVESHFDIYFTSSNKALFKPAATTEAHWMYTDLKEVVASIKNVGFTNKTDRSASMRDTVLFESMALSHLEFVGNYTFRIGTVFHAALNLFSTVKYNIFMEVEKSVLYSTNMTSADGTSTTVQQPSINDGYIEHNYISGSPYFSDIVLLDLSYPALCWIQNNFMEFCYSAIQVSSSAYGFQIKNNIFDYIYHCIQPKETGLCADISNNVFSHCTKSLFTNHWTESEMLEKSKVNDMKTKSWCALTGSEIANTTFYNNTIAGTDMGIIFNETFGWSNFKSKGNILEPSDEDTVPVFTDFMTTGAYHTSTSAIDIYIDEIQDSTVSSLPAATLTGTTDGVSIYSFPNHRVIYNGDQYININGTFKCTTTSSGGSTSGGNADSVDGYSIWTGTMTQYNAIPTKDNNTIYFVKEG